MPKSVKLVKTLPLTFNDLVDNLSSEAKLFADDTSLFSVVYDEKVAAEKLNKDLETISKWAHKWKMQFNPDKNKQAVQVTFSHNSLKPPHPLCILIKQRYQL